MVVAQKDEKVHCVKTTGFPTETEIAEKHFWNIDRFFFTCHNYSNAFQEKKEGKAGSGLCNMNSLVSLANVL